MALIVGAWHAAIQSSAVGARWGFLDEHYNYARQIDKPLLTAFTLGNDAVRIRPVYWGYHAALDRAVGDERWILYLVQGALLLLAVLLLFRVAVRFEEGRPTWRPIACALPLLACPNAETFHTLGKPEALLCLIFATALAILAGAANRGLVRRRDAAGLAACAAMGAWAKEPGVLIVAMAASGSFYFFTRRGGRRSAARLAVATTLGILAYVAPRVLITRPQTFYSGPALDLRQMAYNAFVYLREFPEVWSLGAIVAICLARAARKQELLASPRALLGLCAFGCGAAYAAVLLIWRWPGGYFLTPVCLLWSAAFAFLPPSGTWCLPFKARAWLFGSALTMSIGGFVFVARAQRGLWRGWNAVTEAAARDGARGGTLVLADEDDEAEVVNEAGLHFERVLGRPDLRVREGARDFGLLAPIDAPIAAATSVPPDLIAVRRSVNVGHRAVRMLTDGDTFPLIDRLAAFGWELEPLVDQRTEMTNTALGSGFLRPATLEFRLLRVRTIGPLAWSRTSGLWRMDGWAAPRLDVHLERGAAGRELVVELDALPAALLPLEFKGAVGDVPVGAARVAEPGDRRLAWRLPTSWPAGATLRLTSDRSTSTDELGLRPKGATIGVRIHSITLR